MTDGQDARPGELVPLPPRTLLFGPFRFDTAATRLYRGNIEIHLVPKAAGVLGCLLARPGEIVSKEQFLESVWGGLNVCEESLTQAISTVRLALGDAAHSPKYIQTVPGAGYCFIAPVSARGRGEIRARDPLPPEAESRLPASFGAAGNPASSGRPPVPTRETENGPGGWKRLSPWALVALSLALLAGAWIGRLGPTPVTERHVVRFAEMLPPGRELRVGDIATRRRGVGSNVLALSPRGDCLAYVARDGDGPWRLYLRRFRDDDVAGTPIPGSDGASMPFFSPDGEWVGFAAGGWMYRVRVDGGSLPQPFVGPGAYGGSWGAGDRVVYDLGPWTGLGIASLGGPRNTLTTINHVGLENSHLDPVFLPGGDTVLYTLWAGDYGGGRDFDALGMVSLESREASLFLEQASAGRYLPPGHLVFIRKGQLQAQAFDPQTLALSGSPVAFHKTDRGLYAVSASGDLAYIEAPRVDIGSEIVWVDHNGAVTKSVPVDYIASQVSVSPKGDRIAASLLKPSGKQDIWIIDADGEAAPIQVTFDGVVALPGWSPDGRTVFYSTSKSGAWQTFSVPADGDGEPEPVIEVNSWRPHRHPDGSHTVFERDGDLWIIDTDEKSGERLLFEEEGRQDAARFSDDGKWLAYESTKEGTSEIFVRPYPSLERTIKVSRGGGAGPRWASDGKEIYYHNAGHMMAARLSYEPTLSPGTPYALFPFEGRFLRPISGSDYDVAPDGSVIMVKSVQEPRYNRVQIVLNWVREVEERLARPESRDDGRR